jgi:hypothetical protein
MRGFLQIKVVLRSDVSRGTYDKVAVISGTLFWAPLLMYQASSVCPDSDLSVHIDKVFKHCLNPKGHARGRSGLIFQVMVRFFVLRNQGTGVEPMASSLPRNWPLKAKKLLTSLIFSLHTLEIPSPSAHCHMFDVPIFGFLEEPFESFSPYRQPQEAVTSFSEDRSF